MKFTKIILPVCIFIIIVLLLAYISEIMDKPPELQLALFKCGGTGEKIVLPNSSSAYPVKIGRAFRREYLHGENDYGNVSTKDGGLYLCFQTKYGLVILSFKTSERRYVYFIDNETQKIINKHYEEKVLPLLNSSKGVQQVNAPRVEKMRLNR